jgi:hypothetical protein
MAHKFCLLFIVCVLFLGACAPPVVEPGAQMPASPTAEAYPALASRPDKTATPEAYPWPTEPAATLEPPPTEEPTATVPPFPTLIPTPIVTPIPTAVPPIIPLPPGRTAAPFTIIFPQGDTLWAVNSDNADLRRLVDVHAELPLHLAGDALAIPQWGDLAPDGDRLALVLSTVASYTPGDAPPEIGIYIFDRKLKTLQPLVEGGLEPAWAPDGAQIAYRYQCALWVIDVASGFSREVYAVDRESEHCVTAISWAPDSKRLVFIDQVFRQSAAIVTAHVDQTQAPQVLVPSITNGPMPYLPAWSPNGDQILYVQATVEGNRGPMFNFALWVMNVDGTNQTQLTQDIDVLAGSAPQWSPDGNWIAFGGTRFYEEPEPLIDLWLIDKSGANLKRLTSNFVEPTNDYKAAWSPDGSQIIFIKGAHGPKSVWFFSLTDGAQRHLSNVTTHDIIIGSKSE